MNKYADLVVTLRKYGEKIIQFGSPVYKEKVGKILLDAADAIEELIRPKGKWERRKEPVGPLEITVPVCSVCEHIVPVDVSRYKYCPNCGAAMKEES